MPIPIIIPPPPESIGDNQYVTKNCQQGPTIVLTASTPVPGCTPPTSPPPVTPPALNSHDIQFNFTEASPPKAPPPEEKVEKPKSTPPIPITKPPLSGGARKTSSNNSSNYKDKNDKTVTHSVRTTLSVSPSGQLIAITIPVDDDDPNEASFS